MVNLDLFVESLYESLIPMICLCLLRIGVLDALICFNDGAYRRVLDLEGTNSRQVRCLENERFYRDPDRPVHEVWTGHECSKYFLCLEGEVFEFRCSSGLLFDVDRQICNVKVDNCDVTSESAITKSLVENENCTKGLQMSCSDGTCLPKAYFCDGSVDCVDGSDEEHCHSTLDPNVANSCNVTTCKLPNCFCSSKGTDIPGKLHLTEVPQMVILTFDDAVNFENWGFYNRIFSQKRKNPNGCPIKATFFISHQYNNYYYTQKLWNDGHEIAVHSITHRGPEDWWTHNATVEDWFDEMVGEANILNQFSKVRLKEIRGIRVPFLKVGWNKQFLMMKEFGFVYDSSIVAPFSNPPLWPYTLNHKIPHDCSENNNQCPTHSYPGLWEMVLNQLLVHNYSCAFVDSCLTNFASEESHTILMKNFKRHYYTNRAPFGLYFHSSWFRNEQNLIALEKFLDDIIKQPNVWFVTNWQAIEWIKKPVPSNHVHDLKHWSCKKHLENAEKACDTPNECKLYSTVLHKQKYLYTCSPCPDQYPWIKNEFGKI
ncbi:hypothetical protein FQA39_LY14049 [Lamprigera yunnana]|nr:hypothetical protein FQA39_LY14049 [Lamprigera yunnana]